MCINYVLIEITAVIVIVVVAVVVAGAVGAVVGASGCCGPYQCTCRYD